MASPIELLVSLGIDDAKALANIQRSVRRIQSQTQIDLNVRTNGAEQSLKNVKKAADDNKNSFSALGDTLSTVAKRIASFSLIYGSFNLISTGVRDLTTQVIELDEKLVNLRRVLDIPEYEFNTLLERSIENVSTLSGNLKSYLDLVGEFGRTGLSGDESIALADTATLLQNISDLDAKQSFDAITAAMVNFNIQARDSVQIADALNEVN